MNYRVLIVGPEETVFNTSIANFDNENIDSIERIEGTIQRCLVKIAKCNLLVTLVGWEDDTKSQDLVQIARIAKIPVVHEINFKTYVQPKND